MEYKKFRNDIVVRMDKGEEILTKLNKLCEMENIKLASVTAIGATNSFKIGLFDIDEKEYYVKQHEGNFEIVSLIGNISTMDEKTYIHLHMSAADKENVNYGGHLNEAIVSATCEMIIHIIEGEANRKFDDEVGLNLFDFQ